MKYKHNNLILLELNEINFDVVRHYIDSGIKLNGYERLLQFLSITTHAEDQYDHLEPGYNGLPFILEKHLKSIIFSD